MEGVWRARGRTGWLAPAPGWGLSSAAAVSEAAGSLAQSPPLFTRGKAREVLHSDWSVAPDEMAPDAPLARFSLEDGFADAVAWYRVAGWLWMPDGCTKHPALGAPRDWAPPFPGRIRSHPG